MTDRQPFLGMIAANPDDTGPRLVYADWLEERGESDRAEFIRVQIELGTPAACGKLCRLRWPKRNPKSCRCKAARQRRALLARERELLDAHRAAWFRLLSRRPGFGENEPLRWWPVASNAEEAADRGAGCPTLSAAIEGTPRRGFIDSLTLAWADWLAHHAAITAATPLKAVRFTDRPPVPEQDGTHIWWPGMPKIDKEPYTAGEVVRDILFREYWGPRDGRPGIAFTLPPEREAAELLCETCRAPATYYARTTALRASASGPPVRQVVGIRGWCDVHAPEGASPLFGLSEPEPAIRGRSALLEGVGTVTRRLDINVPEMVQQIRRQLGISTDDGASDIEEACLADAVRHVEQNFTFVADRGPIHDQLWSAVMERAAVLYRCRRGPE